MMQAVNNIPRKLCSNLINRSPKLLAENIFSKNLQLIPTRFESTKWLEYNKKIYPPQEPGEEQRPAFVCHEIRNIKYSPKKMWYAASIVRGMSCEEALKQLTHCARKGAVVVAKAIKEAQEMAVRDHNVEFKTNLWVAESFAGKGIVVKGIRRKAKARGASIIQYTYCHYFIRLEEGTPPDDYYCRGPQTRTGPILLEKWFDHMRKRKIVNSL